MKLIKQFTMIGMIFGTLLSGCGPQYRTTKDYIRGTGPKFSACALQCQKNLTDQQYKCNQLYQECLKTATLTDLTLNIARLSIDKEVLKECHLNCQIKYPDDTFHNRYSLERCKDNCSPRSITIARDDCGRQLKGCKYSADQQYDRCYQYICGGKIKYQTVCVANCEQS
ncbi:MAG: hypothetical protein VXY77_04505 [Pseudomonadota bacterium]|nr:hypothetical protein [Pseudomonadota bacterium]